VGVLTFSIFFIYMLQIPET